MRVFLVVVLFAQLAGCSEQLPSYPPRSVPEGLVDSEAAARAGASLFAEKCASCHGHPGEGRSVRAEFFQPPAPAFSESRYRDIAPAYLFWRIETGKQVEPFRSQGSVMPAWGPYLDEIEIWQLVVYLKQRAGEHHF